MNTLIRYWGSHLKRPVMATGFARALEPLVASGWKAVLVMSTPPDDASWLDPFAKAGVDVTYLPRPRSQFDLGCIARARDLCRRLRADVFHCDNMHTSPTIGAALAGVPVRLWSKRAMDAEVEEMRRPTLRERVALSTRITAGLATKVLAVSSGVRNGLVEKGVPSSKVMVFLNPRGVLATVQESRDAVRARLGYDNRHLVIITVGHSVPVKGWDVLFEAFRRVAPSVPEARLVFVGSVESAEEQPVYERLVESIESHGLRERVQFIGYVADPSSLLAAADLYVLPSHSEGFSRALVEALEVRLPCVTTRVGIAEDFIRDGVNGFLVRRNNPEEMAAAILRLARDPGLRAGFSAQATDYITAPSPAEYLTRLHDLYRSLLAQARGNGRGRTGGSREAAQPPGSR